MKFLIAFALFAVAFADVEPYRLRDAPAPAIEESVDYPYLINVVESPTPVDAPESSADVSNTANIVKFVDFVKGVLNTYGGMKATFEDAEPSYDRTVKFVEEAINEEQVDNENLLVKVMESLDYAAPADFAVNVVDDAVNNINDNASPVKVESLVEEVALSDIAVSFFDEAANDLTDDEAGPVNFVNEAVNKVVPPAEIAPSFNSYAGISKLIENAQEEKYGRRTVIVELPKDIVPTAVNVVENAVNMGQMLAAGVEESYEDSVDVHAKAEAYDDGIPANVVRVVEFPRGKVFDNPMLR